MSLLSDSSSLAISSTYNPSALYNGYNNSIDNENDSNSSNSSSNSLLSFDDSENNNLSV